jgi:hypothetical protein
MAQFKQKLAYALLGGLIVFVLQLSANMIGGNAAEQGAKQPATALAKVKYLFLVDYPLGKKGEYLDWVKSNSTTLQAPEEVKRIRSYDNYFGSSPNRLIEMEFENMVAATKYFEYEKIRKIFEDWPIHGVNASVQVLALRGDYNKK